MQRLNSLAEVYRKGNWFRLSKINNRILGAEASVLCAYLSDKWVYYSDNNKLDNDEFFYKNRKEIEWDTGLSERKQRKCQEILIESGILIVSKKGNPAKNFYKINLDAQEKLFEDYYTYVIQFYEKTLSKPTKEYSSCETSELVVTKCDNLFLRNVTTLYKQELINRLKEKEISDFENHLKGSSKDKKTSKRKYALSYKECIFLFTPDFRNNKQFRKQFKRWYNQQQEKNNRFSRDKIKTTANHFARYFTVDEAIYRLYHSFLRSDKACVYAKDVKQEKGTRDTLIKQTSSSMSRTKQPDPLPHTEEIILETFDQLDNPDIKQLNNFVTSVNEWWKEKIPLQFASYVCFHPETLISTYCDSLKFTDGQPSMSLFSIDHPLFKKLIKRLQNQQEVHFAI